MVAAPHCTGCTGDLHPFEGAASDRGQALSWPTGLFANSVAPRAAAPEPPRLHRGRRQGIPSLRWRDRAEITLWDQIQVFESAFCRWLPTGRGA